VRIYYLTRGTTTHSIAEDAGVEVWARPKLGNPLLSHFAVVVRQEEHGLGDLVVDLRDGDGVRVIPVELEAEGEWRLVRQLDPEASRRAIGGLLDAAQENPQWSVGFNCEDFANRIADGSPRSGQRDFLVVAGILGLTAWWDAREERLMRDARRRAARRAGTRG